MQFSVILREGGRDRVIARGTEREARNAALITMIDQGAGEDFACENAKLLRLDSPFNFLVNKEIMITNMEI